MGTEIERKFLVVGDMPAAAGYQIKQGYLVNDKGMSVRVRQKASKYLLTIKSGNDLLERKEFEYEIPEADGVEMFELCDSVIEKVRFEIPQGDLKWEVDIFQGANEGLVVAEIELPSRDAPFDKPDWVGEEVTQDERYINARLLKHPFSEWK